MIPYSTIDRTVLSRLDAEGSDHYDLTLDRIPAANSAQDVLAGMCVVALESKKFSAEALRDLLQVRIWQASQYGRLHFNPAALGHTMLSIVAVMPEPEFFPGTDITPLNVGSPFTSRLRLDLPYYRGNYSAKRYTREQRTMVDDNVFAKGNEVLTSAARKTYGYINISDYRTTDYTPSAPEIEVFPVPPAPGRYVAVEYLRYPARITQIGSNVEFPPHLTELMVNLTLSALADKQGDGTNLKTVAENGIAKQLGLLGW